MNIPIDEQLRVLAIDLASPACSGYLQRPLPSELDDRIATILNVYLNGSARVRSEITTKLGTNQTWGLLTFAERMAILSVRRMSRDPLVKALIALVVEGFRWDARENMLILSLVNHSAIKIGIDPKQLFEEAACHTSPDVARHFHEFVGRRIEDKSIHAMGYSEGVCPDGFTYTRNW